MRLSCQMSTRREHRPLSVVEARLCVLVWGAWSTCWSRVKPVIALGKVE